MQNCPSCGAAFEGAAFSCPKCGKPLPRQGKKDNYYDDVLPEDGERLNKKRVDAGAAAKIGLIIFGVVLVVAACAAVLSLL